MKSSRKCLTFGLAIVTLLFAGHSTSTAQLNSQSLEDLGLIRGELINVELTVTPRLQIVGDIEIDGVKHHLQLYPHNIRSEKFVIRVQQTDGSFVNEITESRTVRGNLSDMPGSRVIGSVLDHGLSAKIILNDGSEYFVEPILGRVDGAEIGQHVVYNKSDVRPSDHACGVKDNLASIDENFTISDFVPANTANGTSSSLAVAELALDADFEYFQDYGTVPATTARMEQIINIVNSQYEAQVCITHMITGVVVRSNASDPYTSSNAETLLEQFRNEWLSNQGGIDRDVAHLFTGKEINGGTIGIAFLGAICNTNIHYGLSQSDFNNNLGCATDLTTHELGHNWNSDHCNCPSNTMNPGITCANNFAAGTIATISSFRDSLNCLDTTTMMAPPNDNFASTINLGNTFPINTTGNNIGATTETGEQELGNNGATVWWFFTAPDDGTVTVDTFGSDYDTRLNIYDGFFNGATVADLNPVTNNDDAGGGLQSEVSFAVTSGACFEIRVGGFDGAMGNITLNGTFEPDETFVIGDVNCDGVVNLQDIEPFVELLTNGTFDPKGDINQDGSVNLTDIEPFVMLLGG